MGKLAGRLFSLFLLLGVASPLWAQSSADRRSGDRNGSRQLERTKNASDDLRQSYERCQADGIKVTIYQLRGNKFLPVNPGQSFKTGDRIKVKLQSNFDGYVYVTNLTPAGEKRLLFPQPASRHNNVRAGQVYDIPPATEFSFNEETGLEVLQVVMSRSQISFLEGALDRTSLKAATVPLNGEAAKSLDRLTGKPTRLRGSGIATETAEKRKSGLQTRTLTLDSRTEGSILVLAGGKGTLKRFAPGEISMFEIRLNHY